MSRDNDAGGRVVYLVAAQSHDCCMHLGAFTDAERAAEYAEDWQRGESYERANVRTLLLDQPRRSLPGAYAVEIDKNGDVVSEGHVTYTTPDGCWDHAVQGAHWWTSDGERTTRATGAVIRAVGIDREEAVDRARLLLATAPTPDSESSPQKNTPDRTQPAEG